MSNLKSFNLERALAGDPIVMRDGTKIKEIFHSKEINKIIAVFDGMIITNYINGMYSLTTHDYDLFMAPVKKKLFLVVEKNTESGAHETSSAYPSLGMFPENFGDTKRFTIVEIEIEI